MQVCSECEQPTRPLLVVYRVRQHHLLLQPPFSSRKTCESTSDAQSIAGPPAAQMRRRLARILGQLPPQAPQRMTVSRRLRCDGIRRPPQSMVKLNPEVQPPEPRRPSICKRSCYGGSTTCAPGDEQAIEWKLDLPMLSEACRRVAHGCAFPHGPISQDETRNLFELLGGHFRRV